MKYNYLNFDKVILSPADIPTKYPRILVATAYDVHENSKILTSYVAFKGSSGLEKTIFDVADSKLQHQGPDDKSLPMKGHIHNGIYKELVEELPDPMELMTFCDRMVSDPETPEVDQRRLIFCGHGLGGTLSHAAMLNLLFTTFGTDTKGMMDCGTHPSTFTVPLMLNKLKGYPSMAALQDLRKQLNSNFQIVFIVAEKVPLSLDPKDRRQGSTGRTSALLARELEKIAVSIEALKKLPSQLVRAYAGFGQFFKLLDGETCSEIPPSDPVFWTLRWTPECVKNHAMVYYALSDLHPPLYGVPSPRSIQGGKPPQINRANYTLIFGKKFGEVTQIRLEAVGYNLDLCVKERCQVSAFRNKWEIMMVTHDKIMFRNKTKLKRTEIKVIEDGIRVKIETIFGKSDWERVEKSEPAAGSDVIDGLKYVIGKIVILRSVPDRIHPSSSSTDPFRNHLQLVADNSCAKDSLTRFYSCLRKSANRVFDQRKEGKNFIDKVVQHLNQAKLEVKLAPYIGDGETRRFMVRKVGGAGFGIFSAGVGLTIYIAVAALVSAATMGIALPIAAGGLAIGIAALVLSHRRTVKIEDYSLVLRYIYLAINPEKSVLPPETNVADYERAIIHCAENSNAWIHHLSEQLKEQNKTTRERVKNLVQMMLETDKAVKLAKEEKMLAVVGPENAGKSTLINILINGPPKDDYDYDYDYATTGHFYHTDDPKGYLARAVGNLVAVDFPCMQAADERRILSDMWEAFERLPDVCMVMLGFNGDVTADCSEVPRLVRNKLCKRVVLIVNKVDSVMKGGETAPVWKEFSRERVNELREAYKSNCDNMLEDVMLTCLSSQHLYDVEKELLRARGILFAEDVLKKIKRLACSTHLEPSRDTTLLPPKCTEEQIANKCSIPIAFKCSLAAEDEKAVKSVVTGTPVPEHDESPPSDDGMDLSMDDTLQSLKAKNTHSTDQTAPTTSGSISTVTVERDTTRQADEDTRPGLTTKEVNISLLSKGSKELICMKLLHCEKRTDMFTNMNLIMNFYSSLITVGVNIFLKMKALLFKGSGEHDSTSSVRDDTMELRLTADATTSRVTPTEAYTRDDKQMSKNVSVKEHATTISSTGSDVDMKATPLNQTTVPADDSTMLSSIQKPAIASESQESGQSSQHHDVRTEPQETTNGITKSATDFACSTHLESSRDTTLLPSKCTEEQIENKCSIPIALECSLAAKDEKAVKSAVTGTPVPEHEDQTAPTTSGSVERDTTRQADEDTRPGLTTKKVNISLLSKRSKELICMKLLHCEKRTDMFAKINNLIPDKDRGEHIPGKKSFTFQEMIDILVTNASEKNKLIITGDIRWFEKEIELENDNLCILTV
ncbi:hypothetical protein R1flu_005120 [Riccia fluitans]|uniref:G domain-containing protein n=1 Tax=Riccia fluitans TaxID=41844 RepID=A0ABD1YS90_9MARC